MEAPSRAVMAWLSFLSAHAAYRIFSFIDAVLRDDDVATGTCGTALRPRLVSRSRDHWLLWTRILSSLSNVTSDISCLSTGQS